MDQRQIVPVLYAKRGNGRPELLGGELGLPNTGNTFNRHTFVVLTAGALAACASAAVLSCGLCLDASTTVTKPTPPYDILGGKHFPLDLRGARFAVSITDASGNFGQANGAPQLSAVSVGTSYGLIKLADGNHALNSANTSNLFFTVVEKPAEYNGIKQDANTYNGIVIVEIVPAVVQPV